MVPYRGHFLRMNPFQTKNSRPPTVLRTRSDFFSTLLVLSVSPHAAAAASARSRIS